MNTLHKLTFSSRLDFTPYEFFEVKPTTKDQLAEGIRQFCSTIDTVKCFAMYVCI